jgi:hypothetical protein
MNDSAEEKLEEMRSPYPDIPHSLSPYLVLVLEFLRIVGIISTKF